MWYTLRKDLVTASEIASVFNEGYLKGHTKYRLAMMKAGLMEPDGRDNVRLKFGRFIEPFIASEVEERKGWKLHRADRLLVDADSEIGATPDFYATREDIEGLGIVECKSALSWKVRDWEEPPLGYQLQLQTQLHVAAKHSELPVTWGAIAVLPGAGEGDVKIWEYAPSDEIWQIIRSGVAEFLANVRAGIYPEPDYDEDQSTIDSVYATAKDVEVDMSDDADFRALVVRYGELSSVESESKKEKKRIRAQILTSIRDSKVTTCDGYRVVAGQVAPNDGRLVTADMVGTRVGAKRGFRSMRVYPPKELR